MSAKQHKEYDICIVGGGLAGLSCAALLAESGLRIALLEQSPLPIKPARPKGDKYALRVSAINLASMHLFAQLGIADSLLRQNASPYQCMKIWDANSDAHIQFNADDIATEQLGYIIENNIIINALHSIVKEHNNISIHKETLQTISHQADSINLGLNNSTLHTRLLVGADGQSSKVRSLSKIPTELGLFNQTALVCRIHTDRPHQHTAYQCFHHSGPIAYLPLSDGSSSIVWSCDTQRATQLKALDDAQFAGEIERALQSELGAVKMLGPRGAFPLAQQHASRYIDSRVALIGDAAHRTHPLAGLGANLGLQDAIALAEAISRAMQQHRQFYGTATLKRYQRVRKHQNSLILNTMQAFKSGFASHSPGLTALRALALNSADTLQPLKTLITRLATGHDGDLRL